MIQLIPYLVTALLALVVIASNRTIAAMTCIFMIPWWAFEVDIGVSLKTSEILMLLFAARVFITRSRKLSIQGTGLGLLITYLTYCILVAAMTIQFGPDVPEFAGGSWFRNGFGRLLSVTLKWSILISFLIALTDRELTEKSARLLSAYVYACLCLSALGLLQFATFASTGVDLFPIGVFSPEEFQYQGSLNVHGGSVLRVSSLGGEPKGLGMALVIGLFLLWLLRDYFSWQKRYFYLSCAVIFGVMVMTASTSAYLSFVLVVGLWFLLMATRFPLGRAFLTVMMFGSITIIFLIFLYFAAQPGSVTVTTFAAAESYWDALAFKLTGRFQLDDTDRYLTQSFLGDWIGIIFGRGIGVMHHYAYDLAPAYLFERLDGTIFAPKSGVLELMGNGGLVGAILFCLAISQMATGAVKAQTRSAARRVQAAIIVVLAAFLIRQYAYEITFVGMFLVGQTLQGPVNRTRRMPVPKVDVYSRFQQKAAG